MEHNVVRYRHNVISINSLEAFGSIAGGVRQESARQECIRDVYFVRALGMCAHYKEELQKLERAVSQRRQHGLLYKKIKALPALSTVEETAFYGAAYSGWHDSHGRYMETKCTRKNAELEETLGRAVTDIVEKYRLVKPALSETMVKSFVAKMAFWYDFVMEGFPESRDERSSIKLVAHNVAKEQEYLFYYMLTLAGADVLLLQSKADIALPQQLKELSGELYLGAYGDMDLSEYLDEELLSAGAAAGTVSFPGRNHTNGTGDGNSIKMAIPPRPGRKTGAPPAEQPRQTPRIQIPRHVSQHAGGTAERTASEQSASGQTIPSPERREKSFEELALLSSSVVMITVHDKNGEPFATGSGIMVGRAGYILTNHHVASDGWFYTVKIEDDDKAYTTDEIIKYNPTLDLSVIRIGRVLDPLPVYRGEKKLVRGQKVVAIGSPLGFFNSVSDGIISGLRTLDNVDVIQHTAPTSPGSSGGAVLNMYGEVIGIHAAKICDGQNMNLAIGYEYINLFIKGFL